MPLCHYSLILPVVVDADALDYNVGAIISHDFRISHWMFWASQHLEIMELPKFNSTINKIFIWNVPGNPLEDSRFIRQSNVMGKFFAQEEVGVEHNGMF
ncbi:unnamed protein product [Hymenolepis diminuta]|uniref:Uncharacterized protein n=1 Tax=Hymenolepis diminuta TaxID=6216 RepID=A0A564Y0M7_HYMDI|nr:unnamed protein product [Hymenolepis diminuta]